jgi:tRNA dimethylallyltransferase
MKTLIVIAGPTAVGKTAVAIQFAKALQSEIVSADARQIYREMNIGTAKPDHSELASIKHYFVDSHSINDDYDAAQYGEDALQVIGNLLIRSQFAILCGGSGLYIRAVCEGFDEIPEVTASIREELTNGFKTYGIGWLQVKVKELDPNLEGIIDMKNPHRLIRALEIKVGTGESILSFRKNEKRKHNFNIIKIGLELPREELFSRIDHRMDKMITEGLFEEAKSLYPYKSKNALQTVGYQEIFDFLDGQYDYDETVRLLKRNSRRYAKRQLTWFKRDREMKWFSPDQVSIMLDYIATFTN